MTTHKYSYYALLIAILLHVLGVIVAEVRERNGLVSSMISGEKVMSATPVDTEFVPSKNNNQT